MIRTEDLIWEGLYNVEDPEVGVNIVDLGLIYGVDQNPETKTIDLDITLTSAACPLTEYIEERVRTELAGLSENGIRFLWNFAKPWSPAYMTDEGREMMIALGATIPIY